MNRIDRVAMIGVRGGSWWNGPREWITWTASTTPRRSTGEGHLRPARPSGRERTDWSRPWPVSPSVRLPAAIRSSSCLARGYWRPRAWGLFSSYRPTPFGGVWFRGRGRGAGDRGSRRV